MAANNRELVRRLKGLHRLCRAGERGFEVVAANVSNRGLKTVLKSYAQQRRFFARELQEEIQRHGGQARLRRSILGIIHRGRINIRAALTIGAQNVENVVLREAMNGERVALRGYRNALSKELPAEIRAMVERQYRTIQETDKQIELLRGSSGKRLVVRLFDSVEDADAAVQALVQVEFDQSTVEVADVKQHADVYEGKAAAVGEAVVSGAVGGALWGTLIGAVAGVAPLLIPGMEALMLEGSRFGTWIAITLSGVIVGAVFGMILGFLIGHGISEEDAFLYDDSLQHGVRLLRLTTTDQRASEAAMILHQVNAAARARSGRWAPAETATAKNVAVE